VAQDSKTYRFYCRDLTVRSNVDVRIELNLDGNSTFTVEGGIPYTNSALRQLRQVKAIPSGLTALKLQFSGTNLGQVVA